MVSSRLTPFARTIIVLGVILILGLFFRVYHFYSLYAFDHDQDLSAWIARDILVNHHARLIGQLTSIDGVFIGPFYYYILAFLFLVFRMNPLSAHLFAVLIGAATILSIYYVLSKFFAKTAGLIGAFIYSVSISLVFLDRWIVPTMPAVLWSVWLLYILLAILKGNFKVLWIAGILIGLVWHIHVALIPLALLIPAAVFLFGKKIPVREFLIALIITFTLASPFFVFEIRHNFNQTRSLYQAMSYQRQDQPTGVLRLQYVLAGAASPFSRVLFQRSQIPYIFTFLTFFSVIIFLKKQKVISQNQLVILLLWFLLNVLSQQLSKRDISEYYFNNLIIISILSLSLTASYFFRKGKAYKIAILALFIFFIIQNLTSLIRTKSAGDGYQQKKKVVEEITKDVQKNNYACIGINYIADYGKRVGFRYLSWRNGLNVVQGSTRVSVYNIVIPPQDLPGEIKFEGIGLISPKEKIEVQENFCSDPKNQLAPLLNYTD